MLQQNWHLALNPIQAGGRGVISAENFFNNSMKNKAIITKLCDN